MKRYTETVVDWMIRQNVINEKEKELYGYALYSAGLLILPLLFAVGIGFCLGSIKRGIALVVPFMILRKYSGGYHAKNFLIVQLILYYFCFCVSNFLCK
jgi:accessory gene regulator B